MPVADRTATAHPAPVPERRSRGLRPALVLAVVAALTCAVAAPVSGRRTPGGPPTPAAPELGELVSGTSSYVDGTYVWTDYVLDDHGANTVESSVVGPRCTTPGGPDCSGGDATYPAWAAPGGTADLVQLQIGEGPGGRVEIRAILGTLVDPALPVLGVAFDSDADPTTGAPDLGPSWPALDPLGVDHLVVVARGIARTFRWDGGAWVALRRDPQLHIDVEANTIDVVVRGRDLPDRDGTWRVFGGTGLLDPASTDPAEGWTVFDLAYVGDEPFVRWQDLRQADVLLGTGDPARSGLSSSAAAGELDWDLVADGATVPADGTSPGFHTYLYRSALDLPEGTTLPNPAFPAQHEYLGRYQPYLVWVPEELPPGNPLMVSMHGSNNNHMMSIYDAATGNYLGTTHYASEDPFLVGMFVPDFGIGITAPETLVVYPLGRGETLGYIGISEVDVLEVVDDASARFDVDPNRVTLSGASMGGIGTYRLATLYPDRWAAAIPTIGSGVAVRDLFGNLRNVPVRQLNGRLDTGQLGPPSEQDAVLLDALGYDHRFWMGDERGHEVPGIYLCVYTETTIGAVRDPNPSHVTFTVDPARAIVDPERDLDLRHDSAYWLSGITSRNGVAPATVDAVSQALPHADLTPVRSITTEGNTTEGRDLCGPNPAYVPGWNPVHPDGETWLARSLVLEAGPDLPLAPVLGVSFTGVGAVTVDAARAGIAGVDATVDVTSDGDTEVTLVGLSHRAGVALDGADAGRADRHGTATLVVPAGTHQVTITP